MMGASGVEMFVVTNQWSVSMVEGWMDHSFVELRRLFEMYMRSKQPWDMLGTC